MNDTSAALAPPPAAFRWRRLLAVCAVNIAIWTLLNTLGAVTLLNDDLRRGVQGAYWLIFLSAGRGSLALAALSCLLYLGLQRWPAWVASARSIAAGYVLLLLILLPTQLFLWVRLVFEDWLPGPAWDAIAGPAAAIDKVVSLMHWTAITAVYFAVVAIKIWQQRTQSQADGLALRLALEQQHGLALRAQLEPHFMFNALNAVSALVRSDRKEVALTGIDRLSDLLRYALGAAGRDWVSIGDELAFVQDYLALQRMRYGARMQVRIEGDTPEVLAADCPPLLLQPLVENALRHDLDCHQDASDIRMTLSWQDHRISIRISNPVRGEAALNPGAGLGLRNVAARLDLAYGAAATLRTGIVGNRFEVTLQLPEHARD